MSAPGADASSGKSPRLIKEDDVVVDVDTLLDLDRDLGTPFGGKGDESFLTLVPEAQSFQTIRDGDASFQTMPPEWASMLPERDSFHTLPSLDDSAVSCQTIPGGYVLNRNHCQRRLGRSTVPPPSLNGYTTLASPTAGRLLQARNQVPQGSTNASTAAALACMDAPAAASLPPPPPRWCKPDGSQSFLPPHLPPQKQMQHSSSYVPTRAPGEAPHSSSSQTGPGDKLQRLKAGEVGPTSSTLSAATLANIPTPQRRRLAQQEKRRRSQQAC